MLLSLCHAVPPCPISGHMLGRRKRLGRRGANSMAFPDLAWWATWQMLLLLHPSPDHPAGPRHPLFLPHGPGRQQDGAGGETGSSGHYGATLPGPKGQQPWARLVAMAEQQLSQQPWRLPLQVPPMGTAGFPTGTGGKGIYFNKPKQTKPLQLFFSFPLFLTGKDSHVLPAGWL